MGGRPQREIRFDVDLDKWNVGGRHYIRECGMRSEAVNLRDYKEMSNNTYLTTGLKIYIFKICNMSHGKRLWYRGMSPDFKMNSDFATITSVSI